MELEQLLHSLNALDMLELFTTEGINYDNLRDFNINDFKHIGISRLRAKQLYRDIRKEEWRKDILRERLKDVKCEDLYDRLVKIGYTSDEVFSMDHDDLKEVGIFSFPKRKEILERIQTSKDPMIEGNPLPMVTIERLNLICYYKCEYTTLSLFYFNFYQA